MRVPILATPLPLNIEDLLPKEEGAELISEPYFFYIDPTY